MDLIAYRFDCSPVIFEPTGFPDIDDELNIKAKENFNKRLEIIDNLFADNVDVEYHLGERHQPFKQGSDLILRRYRLNSAKEQSTEAEDKEYSEALRNGNIAEAEKHIRKKPPINYLRIPKSDNDETMVARIISHEKGITILRIQKRKPLTVENKNFQKVQYDENYVSSLIILICQSGKQYILIENTNRTFRPATVSLIMESTLNRLLMTKYHIMCTVNPIRRLSDFWTTIQRKEREGKRVVRLRFKFDYPNMPWPDKLLGSRFKEIGRDLEAEAEVIIKGHHGAPLHLYDANGNQHGEINDLMKYSCDKGNMIHTTFDDKTTCTFGNTQTGSLIINLPDELGATKKVHTMMPIDHTKEINNAANTLKDINN